MTVAYSLELNFVDAFTLSWNSIFGQIYLSILKVVIYLTHPIRRVANSFLVDALLV